MMVALALAPGCKLLKPKGEGASEPYGDPVPQVGEAATFDNATEAIIASRPTPTSAEVAALEKTFRAGDYAGALAAAKALADGEGDEERDAAMFVEGASLYYLGRHDEAQSPLDQHRIQFPNSRYAESAQYYQASNLVKLSRWRAGGEALDAFLNRYPESLLMEFALYDRVAVHYALDERDACVAIAERIDREFVYSKIRDRAGVLKGDVLRKQGELVKAEAAFLSAKNLAESYGHPKVAARALRNLIEVAGSQQRWGDSVEYYQAFFQKYPDSEQAPAAALAGLPALKDVGDIDKGLERLENVLLAMPQGTSARSLNAALRTYARYYREKHGPDQLLRRYANLSASGRGSETLREQLIIARLEVLEAYFPERSAEIKVFYEEIRHRFDRRDLSTPTVYKVALNGSESDPVEAAAWFREILARPGAELKAEATLGLSDLQARGGGTGLESAEKGYRKVLETYGTPELAEGATAGLARVLAEQGKWAEARDQWAAYLSRGDWNSVRDEAERGLAAATAKAGSAPAEVKPATPVEAERPSLGGAPGAVASNNRFAQKLAQAERLIAKGMKAEAFEILKAMVEAGEEIEEPGEEARKALRRAGILQEELALELGAN